MKQRPDGVTVIAVYQFVLGFLSLLGAGILLLVPLIVGTATALARAEGGPLATAIVSTVMIIIAAWVLIVGIANIAIGWGLWNLQEWGRIGALVLAVLRLFNFPVGTVIGGVILWYLLREDVRREFLP